MADETNAAGTTEVSEPKGRGLFENKVVVLGMVVIVQAILAFAITQFVIVPKLSTQNAGMQETEIAGDALLGQDGILVGLEEIIVSLQGADGVTNYLRISVNLEVETQQVADYVTERLPQLRDIVITALSSKRAADLMTPEGNLATRAEIFERLAGKLPENSLRNIYFSDLVIQ